MKAELAVASAASVCFAMACLIGCPADSSLVPTATDTGGDDMGTEIPSVNVDAIVVDPQDAVVEVAAPPTERIDAAVGPADSGSCTLYKHATCVNGTAYPGTLCGGAVFFSSCTPRAYSQLLAAEVASKQPMGAGPLDLRIGRCTDSDCIVRVPKDASYSPAWWCYSGSLAGLARVGLCPRRDSSATYANGWWY